MARGSLAGSSTSPPFHNGVIEGHTTVISERDRIVLRRSARAQRAGRLQRSRRTTLVFGIAQVILGLSIVAVSFTAFALSTSNRIRNACPYWAGFSALFTGGVGLIAWKQPSSLAISFFTFLSALCVVLHLVATALSGLSCAELQLISECQRHPGNFVCYCCTAGAPCDPTHNSISIEGVRDCTIISTTIRKVMFVICVANIIACLTCIAATIVGCAYIVKRHASRRMILRRPHHTGSIARESFLSDIGGVIDPIFTPPLVPPPPYSPPEYTEISNDPVIVEGPEFLDDLSTPTPILPVAPHEMPPPYSTINMLPGATIECAVAQEFQVSGEEVSDRYDNNFLQGTTGGDGCLGEGYVEDTSNNAPPVPPLRWDSHNIALEFAQSVGLSADALALAAHPVCSQTSTGERRRRSRNRRRRSPGNGRLEDSDQLSIRRSRNVAQTLPRPGQAAMGMQAPDRTNTGTEDGHDHSVIGPSCDRTERTNRDQNMLEPLENRNLIVRNDDCRSEGFNGNPESTLANSDRNAYHRNMIIDVDSISDRMNANSPASNNASLGSPSQNSHPSENSPMGSSDRLTGGTGSSSSRNTRTSSGNQRRQRRRRSSDRRMRTSSSNYSTSSTDHSSKSSGGIRQTVRARQQQLFSTSSSSDSEEDNAPHRPPRRLVAKMVNGAVSHEIESGAPGAQPGRPSRARRHTRGSRNRQRPVSAQPALNRQSAPQSQGSANTPANGKSGPYHDRVVTCHGLSPNSIHFSQQGRVKQKRPDSLDLKLIWSSHRSHLGQNSLSTSSSADSYDPWVRRDGVNIANSEENIPVNLAVGEASSPKVPEKAPLGIKKKQLRRVAEGRHLSKAGLPPALQQSNNDSYPRICPGSENSGTTDMGLPRGHVIKRDHGMPEKDIDTTECCNFTENSTVRDRPKSMVDFDKDTTALVSEILLHADADISPAVKTVLQDIHSVIANDDKYLSEIWQSACILDKLSSKCSRQRTAVRNGVVRFSDNKQQESVESAVSKSEQIKFRHSCPDADDMLRQAEKILSVPRTELVKSLEGARETIL